MEGKLERWSCGCFVRFDIDDPVHATGRRVIVVVAAAATTGSTSGAGSGGYGKLSIRQETKAQSSLEIASC